MDAILEVNNPAIALAVAELARERDKAFPATGPATADLHGTGCGHNHVHWTYDSWMLAHGAGTATVRAGGDSWFFLTADTPSAMRSSATRAGRGGPRLTGKAWWPAGTGAAEGPGAQFNSGR